MRTSFFLKLKKEFSFEKSVGFVASFLPPDIVPCQSDN